MDEYVDDIISCYVPVLIEAAFSSTMASTSRRELRDDELDAILMSLKKASDAFVKRIQLKNQGISDEQAKVLSKELSKETMFACRGLLDAAVEEMRQRLPQELRDRIIS